MLADWGPPHPAQTSWYP